MNPRALIFDLDGTLLDSFSSHWKLFKATFEKFNIKVTEEEYQKTYSPDWYQVYRAVGLPKESWELADSYWLKAAEELDPKLFPGAYEVLSELKERFKLGLVTSGSRVRVSRDLRRTGIFKFFQVVIAGDDVQEPKPSPQGLQLALNSLRVKNEHAIYVGDTVEDSMMAKSANVRFIGVASAFASLPPDREYPLINSIEEILQILEG
jgi:HAD superfamily hydrolase (TIGR01549 family)